MTSDDVQDAGWIARTFGLTVDQGEVLREVCSAKQLSVAEVLDQVFAAYFARRWAVQWPSPLRGRKRQPLHTDKKPAIRTELRTYGVLLSLEQERVLRGALAKFDNEYGAFSGLVEDAFTREWDDLYGEEFHTTWPHKERLRTYA